MKDFRAHWKRFCAAYAAFIDKQGFAVIMLGCIGVIIFTAVWTGRQGADPVMPSPPLDEGAWAAQLQQESLAQAAMPSPVPQAAWQAPLEDFSVLRGFDASRLTKSGTTGLWQLHDAVDLACAEGQKVLALADGVILQAGDDKLQGVYLLIDHGGGYVVHYAGLALGTGLQAGDPVLLGQTIGFSGNHMAEEADLPPHLHLRATHEGQAVDPLPLWASQTETSP